MSLSRSARQSTSTAARDAGREGARPSGDAPAPLPEGIAGLRAGFLAAVARDTPGSDLVRYTAVLDELLAWVAARPDRVVASAATGSSGAIAFAPAAGTSGPRWSVRPVRGEGPVVEVLPASGADQDEVSDRVRALFNAHSRAVLGPDARPRIGFGALKNADARAALLGLLDELLDGPPAPAAPPAPAVDG